MPDNLIKERTANSTTWWIIVGLTTINDDPKDTKTC